MQPRPGVCATTRCQPPALTLTNLNPNLNVALSDVDSVQSYDTLRG